MKNKLVLFAVSLLVTLWPFFLLVYLRNAFDSGSIMGAVVFFFNLFASIPAAAICWGCAAAKKPGGFVFAGILMILPIVYYSDAVPFIYYNIALGSGTILTGLVFRRLMNPDFQPAKLTVWDYSYVAVVILLVPLHYWIIRFTPILRYRWADFYGYAQPIMIMVISLALCGLIFKERIFTLLSVLMLAMATMTLNDSTAVYMTGIFSVFYGIFIVLKGYMKSVKKPL